MFYHLIKTFALLLSVSLVFGQTEKKEKEKIKETKELLKKEKKELKSKKGALKKLEGPDVSYMAKENFITDFGNVADVKWKRDGVYDEAVFTKDGKEMSAFYDFDSKLIGTTTHVTFADIPMIGQKEIKKKYKGYDIGPVILFNNLKGSDGLMLLFGEEFENQDNYFVEMSKGAKKIVVQILDSGEVFFFKDLQ